MIWECRRCGLWRTRTRLVKSRGGFDARILVLGEGPSRSEDVLGLPFIGASGKLLDALLERAGIPIGECVFANVVLCRPCDSRVGENREPTKAEIESCRDNVYKILFAFRAIRGVVLAGKIAQQHYKKEFKGLTIANIMHPSALYRQGGAASSHYRDALNALRNFYADLKA